MDGFGDPLEGSVERTFPQTGSEGKATGRTQRPPITHHASRTTHQLQRRRMRDIVIL
jgi:hypothetical protein